MTKFYEFSQNNTGGSFDVDNYLCHRVFIEADSGDEANSKGEELGMYWDGCETGSDCPCCGDRWYPVWSDERGIEFPYEYDKANKLSFNNITEYAQYLAENYGWTTPDARIFYKSGKVEEIFSKKVEEQNKKRNREVVKKASKGKTK